MPDPHSQREPTAEEAFAQLVREKREALGWSQEELARRVSQVTQAPFHQTGITRIEGGTRNIRLNEVVALAQALNLDMRGFSFNGQSLHNPGSEDYLAKALASAKAARDGWADALHKAREEMEALIARHDHVLSRLEEATATVHDLEQRLDAQRNRKAGT